MQKQKVDSRIFTHNAPIFSDSQAQAKLDSMDCHDFASAKSRNDDETTQNLKTPAQDSRIFTQNTPIFSDSQAAGFCDDFVGFQGGGEGIYLGDNEQAPAAESRKSAQKPTPKPKE